MPVTTCKAHELRVWASRRQASVADGRQLLCCQRQPATRRPHPQQRWSHRQPVILAVVFCGSEKTTARVGRYLMVQLLQQRNLLRRLHHRMMAPPVAACCGSGRIPGRVRGSPWCCRRPKTRCEASQSLHIEGSSSLPGTATATVRLPTCSRTSRAASLD